MTGVPELRELGERLAAARERPLTAAPRPRRRRRRHGLRRTALALPVLLAVAVPALAGRPLWAPLVEGETPVPPQAPASVRTEVARGSDATGPWRLVAYRAQLRGGGVGTCLFLTGDRGGAGACGPDDRRLRSATHTDGLRSFAFARVPPRVQRVQVRWSDGGRTTLRPRPTALRGGGTIRFAIAVRSGTPRRAAPTPVRMRAAR